MTQLAQVLGVATFGTLYLSLAPTGRPLAGQVTAGHALGTVLILEAAAAIVAAFITLPLLRRHGAATPGAR